MSATGNAGNGRRAGSRNKRTLALLDLVEDGETPCAFALRVMRDQEQPADVRMHAARIAAPYIHPRPQPEPRYVAFELPEKFGDTESLLQVHVTLLRSTADGDLSLDEARELSAILEAHRRLVETVELEARIKKLEELKA